MVAAQNERHVWGVVFEIDQRHVATLDKSEGYQHGRVENSYWRRECVVLIEGSEARPLKVQIYFGDPQPNPPLPNQAYKDQINAYIDIDKKNLPMFKAKMKEILYSDAELKRFQEVAGKPVWDKWVADNQSKFDAKGVLDTLLAEIDKAQKQKK